MERPKKKKYKICQGHITGKVGNSIEQINQLKSEGWNECIDKFNKYLPNADEITHLIHSPHLDKNNRYLWKALKFREAKAIANIIAKRIGKGG